MLLGVDTAKLLSLNGTKPLLLSRDRLKWQNTMLMLTNLREVLWE
jgi:hypothetical protein